MKNCQVLILHGWGRFTGSWNPVRILLEAQNCKVFYPCLPGLDKNQPLNKPWTLDDYVAWAKDYADKNGLEKFFLLGHSFGGRISIKFAAKYPERLSGLILISAAGIRDERISKRYEVFAKMSGALNKLSFLPGYYACRKLFYHLVLRKTDYITLETLEMKQTFKNIIKEDLKDYLKQIKAQTLILWGDRDLTTPLDDAKLMKEKIPGSALSILPGAPHLIHTFAPEKVAQNIIDFINHCN